jgi:hypothetical protein
VRALRAELVARNVRVVVASVSPFLRADMDRHGITAAVGEANVFTTLHDAIDAVRGSSLGVLMSGFNLRRPSALWQVLGGDLLLPIVLGEVAMGGTGATPRDASTWAGGTSAEAVTTGDSAWSLARLSASTGVPSSKGGNVRLWRSCPRTGTRPQTRG